MPRANRHFQPGHVWHVTHRCHKKEFLLKFARDRDCWRHWLFEAKKRYGLCVLNYIITSNHIHLLVRDRGHGEIARSMQLVAGCSAQAYNQRKGRQGAFWEDRYHATAIDSDAYLARCMVYIDLNMVRAGVVIHPEDWRWCGYCEIQSPPMRYGLIDQRALTQLFGINSFQRYQQLHKGWLEHALGSGQWGREPVWTHGLAAGRRDFVERVRLELGATGRYKAVIEETDVYVLKEPGSPYTADFVPEMEVLSADNTVFFE